MRKKKKIKELENIIENLNKKINNLEKANNNKNLNKNNSFSNLRKNNNINNIVEKYNTLYKSNSKFINLKNIMNRYNSRNYKLLPNINSSKNEVNLEQNQRNNKIKIINGKLFVTSHNNKNNTINSDKNIDLIKEICIKKNKRNNSISSILEKENDKNKNKDQKSSENKIMNSKSDYYIIHPSSSKIINNQGKIVRQFIQKEFNINTSFIQNKTKALLFN